MRNSVLTLLVLWSIFGGAENLNGQWLIYSNDVQSGRNQPRQFPASHENCLGWKNAGASVGWMVRNDAELSIEFRAGLEITDDSAIPVFD